MVSCRERRSVLEHIVPLTRSRIPDEIAERITRYILDQGLKAGDKLPSERDLMARFAVGRSSLREAIKTLVAIGVVQVQVGDGMFVGRGEPAALTRLLSWSLLIGEHSIREVIEARRAVEQELVGLAATRATDAEIAAIGDILAALQANITDANVYSRYDEEFHLTIARAARNSVLYQVLDTLRGIVRIWIYKTFVEYEDKQRGYYEHAAIYDALATRDVSASRAAIAAHLDAAGGRLLNLLTRTHTEHIIRD